MSNIPAELLYTNTHEWISDNGDGTVTVGITHHAQELLGDIVFVEAADIGRSLDAGEEYTVIESVKAASDSYAPVSGENDENTGFVLSTVIIRVAISTTGVSSMILFTLSGF